MYKYRLNKLKSIIFKTLYSAVDPIEIRHNSYLTKFIDMEVNPEIKILFNCNKSGYYYKLRCEHTQTISSDWIILTGFITEMNTNISFLPGLIETSIKIGVMKHMDLQHKETSNREEIELSSFYYGETWYLLK